MHTGQAHDLAFLPLGHVKKAAEKGRGDAHPGPQQRQVAALASHQPLAEVSFLQRPLLGCLGLGDVQGRQLPGAVAAGAIAGRCAGSLSVSEGE